MESAKRMLSDAERSDWLRLIRSENVGPRLFFRLLEHFGVVDAALRAAPELSRKGGRKRAVRIAGEDEIASEVAAIARVGARLIALVEPDYPEALAAIDDPPPLITVIGDAKMLDARSVAIVGARNASAAGRALAREIAAGLGEAGLVVVSGMARGIDAAAHDGALATGTVAVLAGGVDVVYPPENAELQGRIAAEAVIVSEQPVGTEPRAGHFPPRNRLISGLALGVLVVEAAPRSGSLITARMALEQGRDVFAVPGSPKDPRARGSNGLIRQGAILTESAADIVDALDGQISPPPQSCIQALSEAPSEPFPAETEIAPVRENVLQLLSPTPVTVDELGRECQLSPTIVRAALIELELAGRVEMHPGNRVSLVS